MTRTQQSSIAARIARDLDADANRHEAEGRHRIAQVYRTAADRKRREIQRIQAETTTATPRPTESAA